MAWYATAAAILVSLAFIALLGWVIATGRNQSSFYIVVVAFLVVLLVWFLVLWVPAFR
jgi:hypothetical protein